MSGEARRRRLRALLSRSGADDIEPPAVLEAFTHGSASREGAGPSNERLEFLGDAILGFIASRWLFARYPRAAEGELTRRKALLVSGDACAESARRLGLGDLILLGHGMESAGGADNTTVLADAFEAYLAALTRSAGLETATAFLEREHLLPLDSGEFVEADAKTALQELTQADHGTTPIYFERAEGPPHDRRYTSQVRLRGEVLGEGIGSSKKTAQQSAAAMALARLRSIAPTVRTTVDDPAATRPRGGSVVALRPRRRSAAKKTPR